MSKFCHNCGNEIDQNAIVCVKCGVSVNNIQHTTPVKQPGRGLGIASMVLGIIAIFYGMISTLMCTAIIATEEFYYLEEKIIVAVIFNFLPIILSIIGLALGLGSISKTKNGMNITGIILSSLTLFICILLIILVIM